MPMTYNSLVLQIQSYLNRTDADTIAQIPNFIYQAEQRICRESKNIGLEQYVTGNFIINNPVITKPGRWRRTLSINYGTGVNNNTVNQLYLRSYEFLRTYWSDPTISGLPLYYSDYGFSHILIAPTPQAAYPIQIIYLELPNPISIANQTNWLTDYAPDLLLYASLLEAIPFLKNDERIPVWEKMYDRGLASINGQDDMRVEDRASNRGSD